VAEPLGEVRSHSSPRGGQGRSREARMHLVGSSSCQHSARRAGPLHVLVHARFFFLFVINIPKTHGGVVSGRQPSFTIAAISGSDYDSSRPAAMNIQEGLLIGWFMAQSHFRGLDVGTHLVLRIISFDTRVFGLCSSSWSAARRRWSSRRLRFPFSPTQPPHAKRRHAPNPTMPYLPQAARDVEGEAIRE